MSNKIFFDLLIKWDRYTGDPITQDFIVTTEMYDAAIFWWNMFKNATWWREDLK